MANTFYVEQFKSSTNLAYIVYALVVVQIVALAIAVVASFAYLADPDWYLGLASSITARMVFVIVGTSTMVRLGAYVLAAVFFFIWLYRAYSNLSPLKARNLEYSPGWAVGWWFVPLVNLAKGFQVMRELWTGSDPDFNQDLNFMPVGPASNATIGFWWGTYLVGNLFVRISDALAGDRSNLKAAVLLGLIGSAIGIISGILFIVIINDVIDRQRQRKENLENIGFGNVEPPPPPIFTPEMA